MRRCLIPHCGEMDEAQDRQNSDWAAYAKRLGLQLRRARYRLGYSQERVAFAAGQSRSSYQQLEKGESMPHTPANPTLKTLIALTQVLDVTLAELLPDDMPDLTVGR